MAESKWSAALKFLLICILVYWKLGCAAAKLSTMARRSDRIVGHPSLHVIWRWGAGDLVTP